MRIIGGSFKGRNLKSFEGKDIRPTSSRLRENLFNILQHSSSGVKGLTVMDIFSGTGAMGIEAISRGAKKVIFVEKSLESISLMEHNLKALNIEDQAYIIKQSIDFLAQGAMNFEQKIDLVFMDAPFPKSQELTFLALEAIKKGNWLSLNVRIIAEVPSKISFEPPEFYEITREVKAGSSKALFIKPI